MAFGEVGASAPYPEVSAAAKRVAPPAILRVFNAAQAEEFARDEEEAHLPPRRLAAYYYARLVALAEASFQLLAQGQRDDVLAPPLRQTFVKLLAHLSARPFEHQLLLMTASPPKADPLALHAVNVAVLAVLAGRLLGLNDGRLCDLGYAALLHDTGRAGDREADEATHVARSTGAALRGRNNQANFLRAMIAREHHWFPRPPKPGEAPPPPARLPHPLSRLVQAIDAYERLRFGTSGREFFGPEAALLELERDRRYDRGSVALLRDLLGASPPGSVVHLGEGKRALVVESGSRRGGRLLVRGLGAKPDEPLWEVLPEEVTGAAPPGVYRSGRWQRDLLAPLPGRVELADGAGAPVEELDLLAAGDTGDATPDATPDDGAPAPSHDGREFEPPRSFPASSKLAESYRLGPLLGTGGQGSVYAATALGGELDGRPVVIKLARPGAEGNLTREQLIYGQGHDGLVTMHEAGRFPGGRPYLILERLELLPGERLDHPRVDPGLAIDVFVHLLEPMRRLHFKRRDALVLCDVKPSNIMLRLTDLGPDADPEAYLEALRRGAFVPTFLDVGVARSRDLLERTQGRLDRVVGTPVYLSPESAPVIVGDSILHGSYSHRTDVYALALSLYVLLTGWRPYERYGIYDLGGNDFLRAVFDLKREGADPLQRAELAELLGAKLGGSLLEVLEAGLAADPDRRASAQTLSRLCRQSFEMEPPEGDQVGLLLRQTRLPVAPPGFYDG
jgi:serine/threonine protein kinase